MFKQNAPEIFLIRSATIWYDDVNQIFEWKIEYWCSDSMSDGAWLKITFSTFDSDQMSELTQFLTSLLMDLLVDSLTARKSVVRRRHQKVTLDAQNVAVQNSDLTMLALSDDDCVGHTDARRGRPLSPLRPLNLLDYPRRRLLRHEATTERQCLWDMC